jgi:phosphatidylinositol-3,4,5-trisphosphate 3-phosphatase/dual-specificity protein phosphatase PTEN
VTLRLKHIRFHSVPNFDLGGGCDPFFVIKGPPPAAPVLYDYRAALKVEGAKVEGFHARGLKFADLPLPDGDSLLASKGCLLTGDFKLCFYDEDAVQDEAMFHCSLHTSFIDRNTKRLVLTKTELDKAIKDKKCEHFNQDFRIELWFTEPVDMEPGFSGERDGHLVSVPLGRMTPPPPAEGNDAFALGADDEDEDEDDEDTDDEGDGKSAADASAPAAFTHKTQGSRQAGAVDVLRGLVSKKKLRYKQDGFDLDLSYITPRIIAMGFPSEGAEAVYRNPMEQVQKFFRQKHHERVRVYNLCSERKYEHAKLDNNVCDIPFHDHNAPAFPLMMEFCRDAHRWLSAHPENAIAVHCKAGKGRTGTLISAYLAFEGHCRTADEALRYFGAKRTRNGAGVTIPSQRRYVQYFDDFLSRYRSGGVLPANMPAQPPDAVALRLTRIVMHTIPNFDIGGGCDPYFIVRGPPPVEEKLYDYRAALKKIGQKVPSCHEKGRLAVELLVPGAGTVWRPGPCDLTDGLIVCDDFKIQFFDADLAGGDDKMFNCSLHTGFINPETLHVTLTKLECDKANKDKKCKHFNKEFKVEFFFARATIEE